MRKLIAGVILAATAVIAGGTGYALHSHGQGNRPCTFDGGGTIDNGTTGSVSTGQTYFCADGQLVRYYQ